MNESEVRNRLNEADYYEYMELPVFSSPDQPTLYCWLDVIKLATDEFIFRSNMPEGEEDWEFGDIDEVIAEWNRFRDTMQAVAEG